MDKEELGKQILSVKDLANRWNYQTEHGVRKRIRYDKSFPEPLKVLNKRTFIFYLSDIEAYEALRGKIDVTKVHHSFYQTKEEWQTKTREEREKQRGSRYDDQEWEKILEAEKAALLISNV